jgi:hypothetical protein
MPGRNLLTDKARRFSQNRKARAQDAVHPREAQRGEYTVLVHKGDDIGYRTQGD